MAQWSRRTLLVFLLTPMVELFIPEAAHAYGGPGSIVSGIGALLAVLAVIVAAVFGFLWFPLKRLYQKFRTGDEKEGVVKPPGTGR